MNQNPRDQLFDEERNPPDKEILKNRQARKWDMNSQTQTVLVLLNRALVPVKLRLQLSVLIMYCLCNDLYLLISSKLQKVSINKSFIHSNSSVKKIAFLERHFFLTCDMFMITTSLTGEPDISNYFCFSK